MFGDGSGGYEGWTTARAREVTAMSIDQQEDTRVWRDRAEPDQHGRGREAEAPTQIPHRGWWDVLMRTKAEVRRDNVALLAAGIAFYALLALVPALVAVVSIYGLAANPADIARHVGDVLGAAPEEVRDLVVQQLRSITEGDSSKAGWGVLIGIAIALWSASSGTKHAIEAVNAAYDEEETRGFIKLRFLSLVLTLGAVLFFLVAMALVAFLPAALDRTSLPSALQLLINIARWPLLALGVLVALAIFYRYAPDRDEPRWRWVSAGAVVASLLWLAGSVGFAFYAANFGRYNETYGSLGAIVVVMLWLFLSAFAMLLGAELNAELERQTRKDSTDGRPQPLGRRQAYAADTVGETASEVRQRRKHSRKNGRKHGRKHEAGDEAPAHTEAATTFDGDGAARPDRSAEDIDLRSRS
jgi:membrane protein